MNNDEYLEFPFDLDKMKAEAEQKSRKQPEYIATKRLKLINLVDVEIETVNWLWKGYTPLGMITLIDGDPGLGKSTLTTYMGSCVSQGIPLEGDTEPSTPRKVIVASTEDHIACVIKPRYKAAGANMENILYLECVEAPKEPEAPFMLPDHIDQLETACLYHKPALVIIDPLMSVLSPKINSYSDQGVRQAMSGLKRIAEKSGAAIACVRHLNKSKDSSALYKGGGSIGIIGAARLGLLVAKHPEDSNLRVLSGIKSNIGKMPPSIMFELISETDSETPHLKWRGQCNYSADDLVQDFQPQSKKAEAEDFLRSRLSKNSVPQSIIESESKGLGISSATLNRAKVDLGIKSTKSGEGGAWEWQLPQDAQGDQDTPMG